MEQLSLIIPEKVIFSEDDVIAINENLKQILMNAGMPELFGKDLIRAELLKTKKQISIWAKGTRPIYLTIDKKEVLIHFPEQYREQFEDLPVFNIAAGRDKSRALEGKIDFTEFNRFSEKIVFILIKVMTENSESCFGCCHLFNECSDARRCLQTNKLFALRCYYKRNLEKGLIFFGANPTAGANAKHIEE